MTQRSKTIHQRGADDRHGTRGPHLGLDRRVLLHWVVILIFACLLINLLLVIFHLADSHAFSERVGAVFCGACGALITLLTRSR